MGITKIFVNKNWLLLMLVIFLVIPSYAHAVTYYVDSTSGNDSNNGTSAPWKTISKVNKTIFQSGDSILFKRGCVWREQLTISSSGAAGNPIIFGAYGTGEKPIISGADIVGLNGWTTYKGNIYVTSVGSITSPTQLYVDGKYYDIAHYPNSGWLLATSDSSDTTSIIDTNLSLSRDTIVGATVMSKAVPWYIKSSKATGYDSSTHKIILDSSVYTSSTTIMKSGYGYYLQNMLWMLDSPGEWYYDPVGCKIYLYTSEGDSPADHIVEVSNRAYGIYSYGKGYFTIQDLTITKANKNDVHISTAKNVLANQLDISGGIIGIYFVAASYSSILNSSIQYTLSNGIQAITSMDNIEIKNNIVNYAGNVGVCPKTRGGGGMYVKGNAIIIENNNIRNSGYNGIIFGGNPVSILNNVIDKSCLLLNDGAGIYTGGVLDADASKTIKGNTVTNSIGNIDGTPSSSTIVHGIYLDDGTFNTTVSDNIISDTDMGIYINTGHNNTITNNKVFKARKNALLLTESGVKATYSGAVHDNIVTNNVFESISAKYTVTSFYSRFGDITKFGTYDFNTYYHPNLNYVVKNQNVAQSLQDWQKATGQDLNSTDAQSSTSETPMAPINLRTTD